MKFDEEELRTLLAGKVTILCHHNADPDAVCSAHALKELAESLHPESMPEIILPSGASVLSQQIIDALNIETGVESRHIEPDTIFAVDTGSLSQLGTWEERVRNITAPKVFIDHHVPNSEIHKLANVYIIDDEATSTCEIVYMVYRQLGVEPTPNVAQALLTGIAFDSKFFTIGSAETFRAASELLEIDGAMSDIGYLLTTPMDPSEVIARLKAAQRMDIHLIDGWVAVTSELGSFQSSAARGLLSLGADLAIVAGSDKGNLKASMRSKSVFYKQTQLHLGKHLAYTLGEEFNGSGSGHPTAAGVNANAGVEVFLCRVLELVRTHLGD